MALLCSLQMFAVLLRNIISPQGACIWTEQPKFVQTTFKGQNSDHSWSTFLFNRNQTEHFSWEIISFICLWRWHL